MPSHLFANFARGPGGKGATPDCHRQTGAVRPIAASVLVFEAIVVLLAIPVAITLADVGPSVAGLGGGLLAVACLMTAGLLRRSWGYTLGWVLQGLLVLTGFVVPAMFLLGIVFAGLWAVGLQVGRRGELIRAKRWAGVADPRQADDAPTG